MVKQPAKVLQGIRHALQKMCLALIKAAKAIRAQRLHDAGINVCIIMLHEGFPLHVDEIGNPVDVGIQQLLAQFGRQVGLGII